MLKKSLLILQKNIPQLNFQPKTLQFLKNYEVNIDEYLYCYALYNNISLDLLPIRNIEETKKHVEEKNLDKILNVLFKDDLGWVEKWQELWPVGVKQNGVYVKSDIATLKNKFRKFLKIYNYDVDTIVKATKFYLKEQQRKGYEYISQAHYFIEKNNVSQLASMCENPSIQNETSTWVMRA